LVRVFLDTSAIYSLAVRTDQSHAAAAAIWNRLLDAGGPVFTTNYVLLEAYTLLQRRLGMDAVKEFNSRVVPYLTIVWVDDRQHSLAVESFFAAGERRLSLVDCSSFVVCRDIGVDRVFAFDRHFERAGFQLIV
jgi:uncharacterized protein